MWSARARCEGCTTCTNPSERYVNQLTVSARAADARRLCIRGVGGLNARGHSMVAPARGASSDVRRAWRRAKSAASSAMRRLGRTWGWSSSSSSASPGSSTRVVVFGDGDEAGENASRAGTPRGARGGCLPSMRAVSRLAGFAQGETRGANATRRAGRRYADRAPRGHASHGRLPKTPARRVGERLPVTPTTVATARALARGEREPLDRAERLAALATRGGVLAPGRLPETPAARTLTTTREGDEADGSAARCPAKRVVDRRDADTRANHHLETDPDASTRADERLVRERDATSSARNGGWIPEDDESPPTPASPPPASPDWRRRTPSASSPLGRLPASPTSETSRRIFHPDSPTGTSWTNRTMRSAEGFDRLEISEKSKSASAAETRVPGSVRSATTSPAKESFDGGAGTRPSAPRASFDGERATFALEETRSTSGRTLGEELSATRFAETCPSRRPAEGGRVGGGRSSDASPPTSKPSWMERLDALSRRAGTRLDALTRRGDVPASNPVSVFVHSPERSPSPVRALVRRHLRGESFLDDVSREDDGDDGDENERFSTAPENAVATKKSSVLYASSDSDGSASAEVASNAHARTPERADSCSTWNAPAGGFVRSLASRRGSPGSRSGSPAPRLDLSTVFDEGEIPEGYRVYEGLPATPKSSRRFDRRVDHPSSDEFVEAVEERTAARTTTTPSFSSSSSASPEPGLRALRSLSPEHSERVETSRRSRPSAAAAAAAARGRGDAAAMAAAAAAAAREVSAARLRAAKIRNGAGVAGDGRRGRKREGEGESGDGAGVATAGVHRRRVLGFDGGDENDENDDDKENAKSSAWLKSDPSVDASSRRSPVSGGVVGRHDVDSDSARSNARRASPATPPPTSISAALRSLPDFETVCQKTPVGTKRALVGSARASRRLRSFSSASAGAGAGAAEKRQPRAGRAAREWEHADAGSDPDPDFGGDDEETRLFAALEKLVSATADDAETETRPNANAWMDEPVVTVRDA